MSVWLQDFARSHSREELSRQYSASRQVENKRLVLALVPFAVAALYLPPFLCLVFAILNSVFETLGLHLMAQLDPARSPARYSLMLVAFSMSQLIYGSIPALVWQDPDGFAKSFAVGMFVLNLIHLATVRSVHLPLTLSSLVVSAGTAALGNSIYWISSDDWVGLAISSVCLAGAVYFVHLTMTTVHQMHEGMNRDRQAANAANEAKSRFLAQMSHELRTPLNAILGMGYAEMTTAASPESQGRLSTLVQSARSLSVLLDDILDLSAVEAGQLPIRPTTVNVRSETNATLALFRQQILDTKMTKTVVIAEDVPEFAVMDGQRFRQCLSNLMSNAIKYSQRGTIEITVTAPDPNRLDVLVADSGPGVPERLRDHIFEPFHRGDSVVVGTGLGLSISRTLARRMGGDLVLLHSGRGARFLLSIAVQSVVAPHTASSTLPLADLGGRRVLVVDDIATNRLVAMTYLRNMGAHPVEAEDGAAALIQIAADTPDVVLLDMLMPKMDGVTTLQRVRALPGRAGKVPVIAMTADATEERRLHYLASGLDGYVAKPLSPEALGASLQAVLSVKGG